jgi:hypothetical protein
MKNPIRCHQTGSEDVAQGRPNFTARSRTFFKEMKKFYY